MQRSDLMYVRINKCNLHGSRELAERLVEIIHLCQDTDYSYNYEDISRGVDELIFTTQCQLHCNTERLD